MAAISAGILMYRRNDNGMEVLLVHPGGPFWRTRELGLAPQVYLVGEAPGRQEAEAGRPFVGPAGTALRDMMREAGMDEAQIRLANALPFRPIERSAKLGLRNRRPTEKELRDYGPIVLADIANVRPKLIIALGKSAASLFGASTAIAGARRQVFCFWDMPVRITYHPGFVLRFGGRGSQLWRTAVRDLRTYWKQDGITFSKRRDVKSRRANADSSGGHDFRDCLMIVQAALGRTVVSIPS